MAGDFGRRAFWALNLREQREGRPISQAELGDAVGRALGRAPVHQSTAGRWIKPTAEGGAVPDVATIEALARYCGVDPGWLAFGPASGAPVPVGYVEPEAVKPARRGVAKQSAGGTRVSSADYVERKKRA